MELQALDLTIFPHFMKSCLSCCHQSPVPTEPCAVSSSQHLGWSAAPPQAPDTVHGAFSSRSSAATHGHPAPSPPLWQHSSVQPHAEPAGGTDPAGSPPACKRQRAVSQSGRARSPAHGAATPGAVQVCVGCLHLHIGASHLPLKQMGASAQQT